MKKNLMALLLAALMLLSVIPASADSLLPWTGEELTYHFFMADIVNEKPESAVCKEIQADLGNIDIIWELAPNSDYNTKLSLYKNSGQIPELLYNGDASQDDEICGMDVYLDFAPYLEYMPNVNYYLETMPIMKNVFGKDGSLYAVGSITEYDYGAETWFYNKTALTEMGYDAPPATWDEMYEMMLAYKEYNPDGWAFVTYAWGLNQWWSSWAQLGAWERSDFFYNEKTQAWDSSILNDESGYKALVEHMHLLYADGLIPPDFDAISEQSIDQYVVTGNWLFGFFYNTAVEDEFFKGTEMPYELGHFVTPALTEGAQRYGRITGRWNNVGGIAGYMAAADVHHPEVVASLFDYCLSPEGNALYHWGIEGVSYEVDENGTKHFLDDYATNVEKREALGIDGSRLLRMCKLNDQFALFDKTSGVGRSALAELLNSFEDGTLEPCNFGLYKDPTLTVENGDLKSQNQTPTATYLDEQRIKFITGERPMEEWDTFVEEYQTYGDIQLIIKILNEGEQNPIDQERRYMKVDVE